MKNRITPLLSLLLFPLLAFNNAIAEEGITPKLLEYDVEVIIFEDANARYINNEDWNQDGKPDAAITNTVAPPENLGNLSTKEINATSYQNIKPQILKQDYKRINGSKEYNVLFYGSWRQTGLDDKKAFEINIEELKNNHKTTSDNTITGNLKLVLARYLHIYGEMEYQRKLADTAKEQHVQNNKITELKNKAYPINIHRRMRSKELHYIDHPLVGMLIKINPVKVVAEQTTEKSEAS